MYRLLFCFFISGLLFLADCSRQEAKYHKTSSSKESERSYTGDWKLLGVYCNGLPVHYSGFTEQLKMDQEDQEAILTVSGPGCEIKVNFDITKRNNNLTLTSSHFRCSPNPCSITPKYTMLTLLEKTTNTTYSCPDNLPSGITVEAELYNNYESLRTNIPIPNSSFECEFTFSKNW